MVLPNTWENSYVCDEVYIGPHTFINNFQLKL